MNTLKKFRHLFDPIDLTKGSILKDMVIFLIPILLSMVFQQIYTTTDAIVVGQNLGPNEIAGINDVGPLSGFALQFAIGCTSGFSVIIANKIGEANLEDARKSFLTQIILSLIISVVLTVAFCLLTDPLLSLMKIVPSSSDTNKQAIYQAAHDYLFIIYLGIICQMAYNQIFSVLRALGDSYTPFLFLVLGTVLNIFLDILFIVPLKWGVAGSAWATILSELSGSGRLLYLCLPEVSVPPFPERGWQGQLAVYL
jgi:putative MATE family efflux protein